MYLRWASYIIIFWSAVGCTSVIIFGDSDSLKIQKEIPLGSDNEEDIDTQIGEDNAGN